MAPDCDDRCAQPDVIGDPVRRFEGRRYGELALECRMRVASVRERAGNAASLSHQLGFAFAMTSITLSIRCIPG